MRRGAGVGLLVVLMLIGPACARRGSGEIDVDQVQGYVNAVEGHLRGMRRALRERKLEQAQDEFEEAQEILRDRKAALAAYPEASELIASVHDAEQGLCYGAVNIALHDFFESVRAKDLEEARERLRHAHREHDRCREAIAGRQDYPPLKMNLDSAPKVLTDLEREIARPALLEKIAAAKRELDGLRKKVAGQLAALEKNPAQREVAVALHTALGELDARLRAQPDFGGEKEWLVFAATVQGEIAETQQKRQALVRRGKILVAVRSMLPPAERNLILAAREKDRGKAKAWLGKSVETFDAVGKMIAAGEKEEPGLAKFTFTYKGKKRTVAWLARYLAGQKKKASARIARLEGKKPAPPPKKQNKKRRKRSRGRRIRRW